MQILQYSRSRRMELNMERRKFLRIGLISFILSLFGKRIKAEEKPEETLKEAMFWRSLDDE
jgi:hypothetical protein